jgi:hypothetical protein
MAAPRIPPIRPVLTGAGLAVEKLHRPTSCWLADRYVVTGFTDQSRRSADHSASAAPLRRRRDSAGLFHVLPGQRINSSASFAA